MDYHRIKDIIERFWLGETSLEEENTLKEYFLYNENPPAEFETTAAYFKQIVDDSKLTLDDSFDQEVMNKIQSLRKKKSSSYWKYLVAASIALWIGITILHQKGEASDPGKDLYAEEFVDTYDDPEEAYRNVKAALMMVSSGINKGASFTSELRKFDEAQKEIIKTKKDEK